MKNVKMIAGKIATVLVLVPLLALTGCNMSKAVTGGLIGAGAGGGAGAAIGAAAGGKKGAAIGAIIGAAVGGTAGGLIGNHMQKRADKMKQEIEGASVERVGEGILVTFDSGILFDTGKADLKSAAQANVESLSKSLVEDSATNILVVGHTDAQGGHDMNMSLSEQRAQAVADYAATHGVEGGRLHTVGKGEMEPVASNETPEGRTQNRRVEIAIYANQEMIEAAKAETLD